MSLRQFPLASTFHMLQEVLFFYFEHQTELFEDPIVAQDAKEVPRKDMQQKKSVSLRKNIILDTLSLFDGSIVCKTLVQRMNTYLTNCPEKELYESSLDVPATVIHMMQLVSASKTLVRSTLSEILEWTTNLSQDPVIVTNVLQQFTILVRFCYSDQLASTGELIRQVMDSFTTRFAHDETMKEQIRLVRDDWASLVESRKRTKKNDQKTTAITAVENEPVCA